MRDSTVRSEGGLQGANCTAVCAVSVACSPRVWDARQGLGRCFRPVSHRTPGQPRGVAAGERGGQGGPKALTWEPSLSRNRPRAAAWPLFLRLIWSHPPQRDPSCLCSSFRAARVRQSTAGRPETAEGVGIEEFRTGAEVS